MDPTALNQYAPLIQTGFAGFSVALLAAVLWLVRTMVAVNRTTNRQVLDLAVRGTKALEDNTTATAEHSRQIRELRSTTEALRTEVYRGLRADAAHGA